MAGLYESVSQGLSTGYQMGSAIDAKRQGALDAKKQELLGGLGRASLGLGGENEQQQFEAQKQLAAIDPELFKKVQDNMKYLQSPELKKIQATNKYISLGASNLRASPNDKLANNIFQAVKAYQQMGLPEVAEALIPMISEAQTHPEDVKKRLEVYEKFSYDVDREIELNLTGRAETEKKFKQDELGNASKYANLVEDKAASVNQKYNLLDGIIKSAKDNGDPRIMSAAAITAIARMVSDEAVQESDIARYSGSPDPLNAALQTFKGDKKIIEALNRSLDPYDPKYFNIENLRDIADSSAKSYYDSLGNQLQTAKTRFTKGGGDHAKADAYFGELNSYNALGEIVKNKQPSATKDKFVVGNVYTDAKGNKATYLGNGNWE